MPSSLFNNVRLLAYSPYQAVQALGSTAWNTPRRNLSGKNACRSYFSTSRLRRIKRQRKEAYDWILDLAVGISARAGKNEIDQSAWRVSARKWMEKKRMIVIRKTG